MRSSLYSPPLFNQTAQPNWYHSAFNVTCQKIVPAHGQNASALYPPGTSLYLVPDNENRNLKLATLNCANLFPEFGISDLTTVQIDPTPPLVGSSSVNSDPLAWPPLSYYMTTWPWIMETATLMGLFQLQRNCVKQQKQRSPTPTNPNKEWTKVFDPAQRRRIQNSIAQRQCTLHTCPKSCQGKS